MSNSPDWSTEENYTSLKTVLKWELQHLLQRLAEVGEEALLLTVSVKDGGTTEMGSPRGQVFLSMSDLQNVKSEFKSYCQGVSDIRERMEIYRDLSSGQLSLGPKISNDSGYSEHRRKRRKKTYLQHAKMPRFHGDQESSIKQELSSTSDDNSGGNERLGHHEQCESTAGSSVKLSLPMLSMRSRRKRIPQKVIKNLNNGEDDNNDSCIPDSFYPAKNEYSDNRSVDLESSGSYVKKSQSVDQLSDDQPEVACNTEEISINGWPYDHGDLNIGISNMKSISTRRSFTQLQVDDNNELSSLLRKTNEMASKKSKDYSCKSTNLNPVACLKTNLNNLFGSEKSVPVFPNFDNLNLLSYENSVGVANNVGGAMEDCSPMAAEENGCTSTKVMKGELDANSSGLQNEDSCLLGRLSKSAESSPKLNIKQEYSPVLTPSRKKGFKPVPHDENPAETALLDASKLEMGRYKCPMCGQTTRDRHDLKRHLRTHTKEKPFKCSVCGKKFTRKWDLENHYTRHNKTERDKANSKIGRQFNKAIEESNAEILTYDKLVSKLLRDNNITVRNFDEEEGTDLGYKIKKPNYNSGRVLRTSTQDGSESETNLSADSEFSSQRKDSLLGKIPKEFRASSKKEIASEETCSNDINIENTNHDHGVSQEYESIEAKTDAIESMPSEDVLDSSLVKFMNDITSTVSMETESEVKSEREAGSDGNNDLDLAVKEEVIDTGLFSKFDNDFEMYKITTGSDVSDENETGSDVKMTAKQEVM